MADLLRYPFSDEFERDEDAWEAPDALGIAGAEATAARASSGRGLRRPVRGVRGRRGRLIGELRSMTLEELALSCMTDNPAREWDASGLSNALRDRGIVRSKWSACANTLQRLAKKGLIVRLRPGVFTERRS